jgi:tRNA dihydrouridine synthase A
MISVAPMIQWTDAHFRYYVRGITKNATLYTEMVMDEALVRNRSPEGMAAYIGHSSIEHPLVLQLGGSQPEYLADAAYLASKEGCFREINLNAGCPSDKAKAKMFGAALMLDGERLRQIVYEMQRKVSAYDCEITVKTRLGCIDNRGKKERHCRSESIDNLIDCVRSAGCRKIILHARDCLLGGLSPAQNRTVPPLRYDEVYNVVKRWEDMKITLNGGLSSIEEGMRCMVACEEGLGNEEGGALHGFMIGRAVYRNPWILRRADKIIRDTESDRNEDTRRRWNTTCTNEICEINHYSDTTFNSHDDGSFDEDPCCTTRLEAVQRYLKYADKILADQDKNPSLKRTTDTLPKLCKPLHHTFWGSAYASDFRGLFDASIKQSCGKVSKGTGARVITGSENGNDEEGCSDAAHVFRYSPSISTSTSLSMKEGRLSRVFWTAVKAMEDTKGAVDYLSADVD